MILTQIVDFDDILKRKTYTITCLICCIYTANLKKGKAYLA